MGLAIQIWSYAVWFPLKVLGITALFRLGLSRYWLIFVYMVGTFLIAVAQIPLSLAYQGAARRNAGTYEVFRSLSDGFTYVVLYVIVFNLIYRASAGFRTGRMFRRVLVAGGFLFIAISFLAHYSRTAQLSVWMTPWTRDLSFCAAILDLAAWGMLLHSGERDPTLLLLTGGMGIMFAGEAIGASIRNIAIAKVSTPIFLTGHVLTMLTDALYLYVWWQAFRKEAARRSALKNVHVALGGA